MRKSLNAKLSLVLALMLATCAPQPVPAADTPPERDTKVYACDAEGKRLWVLPSNAAVHTRDYWKRTWRERQENNEWRPRKKD